MKQYQTTGAGTPLELIESATPAPTGSEILLRTRACGVCHSDVHLHDGEFDLGGDRKLPVGQPGMTLGHEIMGEVVALGPEAAGVAVGDLRVVYPWIGCGTCSTCLRGDEHLCMVPSVLGIQKGGGFGDHVLVPDARYLFDFGSADPALAATYACSGLTAYSALKRVGKLAAGDHVVIVGAGGLGQMALQIGRAAFGLTPIVVDIDAGKLDAAKAAGAAHVINSKDADAAKQIKGLTDGGAVAALDFVGSEPSANFSLSILRKGGKLVVVGLYGGQLSFPLPFFPMMARIIEGNYVGSLSDMAELMTLVREGRVEPIRIDRRPAADVESILGELKAGRVQGRAVLVYD
ncbi:MAG: alcohol dehydrogenase catalytic domain-containing protein [Gammaproteobacteria bacterium]|nr:alcohol dehydrogenase catalytic domain-containing protein [Gammaproteobacteria bacterium]